MSGRFPLNLEAVQLAVVFDLKCRHNYIASIPKQYLQFHTRIDINLVLIKVNYFYVMRLSPIHLHIKFICGSINWIPSFKVAAAKDD